MLLKTFLLTLLLSFSSIGSYSQTEQASRHWNFKLGYAHYQTFVKESTNKKEFSPNYRIEANYRTSKFFEAGLYTGFSNFTLYSMNEDGTQEFSNNYFTPFYGINLNFHLLPLFIKSEACKFEIYLTGKIGGLHFPDNPSNFVGNTFEYGIGGGIVYNVWRNLGVYSEFCYGEYFFYDNTKFRFGISYKL